MAEDSILLLTGIRTTSHENQLLYPLIENQRDVLKHAIQMSGETWPTSNKDLIAKYLGAFTTFINSIDFDKLTQ